MKNKACIQTEQTTDLTQNRTHIFKMLNATNIICGNNCET